MHSWLDGKRLRLRALAVIAGFRGLKPADHPVAYVNDVGEQTIVGKPAIEENETGINPIAEASQEHLEQDLRPDDRPVQNG